MLNWINLNEPLWLFILIGSELLVGLATFAILLIEYFYDKDVIEKKKKKTTKNKVKIVLGKDGQYQITEAPKGIDISIEQKGD
jgi:hypothetical protein